MLGTSCGGVTGTVRIGCPVAGFSTVMPAAAPASGVRGSTVAMARNPSDRAVSLGDGQLLDRRRLLGPVAPVGGQRLERVDDVHAAGHLAEHGVLAVEPGRGIGRDDEELRAVGVRAGVRHGQRSADDLVLVDLVLERVAGAAGAGALRTAAL